MKGRRFLRAAGPALLLAVGGAYALASVDWCGPWPHAEPVLLGAGLAQGELQVGAARAEIAPPYPIVVAGYSPPRPEAKEAKPALEARAMVLEIAPVRVAIVTLDLLLVPPKLVERIRAEVAGLGFSDVWVVATHAHSSLGGFDDRDVSELAGTGRFREDALNALVTGATAAIRDADASRRPAVLARSEVEIAQLVRARSGDQADARFMRLVFRANDPRAATNFDSEASAVERGLDGGATELAGDAADAGVSEPGADSSSTHTEPPVIAELWLMSAHPTLVPRATTELSPDYPGLVDSNDGPVVLVMQAAVGNASAEVPEGEGDLSQRFAAALRRMFEAAPATRSPANTLGFSRVQVSLPRPDASRLVPWFTRAAGDNFLCRSADRVAEVGALRLGDHVFIAVPAEATAAAAAGLEAGSGATRVLSVANGYLGYVEPADSVKAHRGEAKRQYFGPELLSRLQEGAVLAVKAVKPGAGAPVPPVATDAGP